MAGNPLRTFDCRADKDFCEITDSSVAGVADAGKSVVNDHGYIQKQPY